MLRLNVHSSTTTNTTTVTSEIDHHIDIKNHLNLQEQKPYIYSMNHSDAISEDCDAAPSSSSSLSSPCRAAVANSPSSGGLSAYTADSPCTGTLKENNYQQQRAIHKANIGNWDENSSSDRRILRIPSKQTIVSNFRSVNCY